MGRVRGSDFRWRLVGDGRDHQIRFAVALLPCGQRQTTSMACPVWRQLPDDVLLAVATEACICQNGALI